MSLFAHVAFQACTTLGADPDAVTHFVLGVFASSNNMADNLVTDL